MNKIRRIEEGNGIEFTIIIKGIKTTYELTLAERLSWKKDDKGDLVFIFISKNKKYFASSCYSGGNTGFGISNYDFQEINEDFHKEYLILTSNLDVINQIADAERNFDQNKEKEYDQKQRDKVERINNLPKCFDSIIPEFEFERTDVKYDPSHSKLIRGGYIKFKNKNNDRLFCDIKDFVTKDGKKKVKNFINAYGTYIKDKDPKEILESLLKQHTEIKNMINNA